jgi:hypothetical protein
MEREDTDNVKELKFEKGKLVFVLMPEGQERNGYTLPLPVGLVLKVLQDGFTADIQYRYMWGTHWDGPFHKWFTAPKPGGKRRSKAVAWTDTIKKDGVVLMRGQEEWARRIWMRKRRNI